MMRHTILQVGRLRRRFFREAVDEYQRRLEGYARVRFLDVPEEKSADPGNAAEKERVLEVEGRSLSTAAESAGRGYWIALDERGKMTTSEGLAAFLQKRTIGGESHFIWFIGGPMGLSEDLKGRCALRLALSRMTFPHEMVPMILAEQIYRAHRIMRGEPYHL